MSGLKNVGPENAGQENGKTDVRKMVKFMVCLVHCKQVGLHVSDSSRLKLPLASQTKSI